jgi:hypothetical protein
VGALDAASIADRPGSNDLFEILRSFGSVVFFDGSVFPAESELESAAVELLALGGATTAGGGA